MAWTPIYHLFPSAPCVTWFVLVDRALKASQTILENGNLVILAINTLARHGTREQPVPWPSPASIAPHELSTCMLAWIIIGLHTTAQALLCICLGRS